ncbi:3-oxoacyl-(acyl-carrier-protein) synthase 2 [Oleidesulfovibrio alaskensis G20]|jgi:3-oxoacyl-[acyl-carrier-protein] synthase II|uniref:3-oxoacyl-[acyl-carrier-protein] synthase 2 n=1 Tax=Oleidesulfovibrio alaskensis (strain ATCC BAA-1058 / DSM 17464 / G20) TaxID=207559 RepID=Q30YL8_OLEA2|nr:beta-ketoacyl-ACP synthase II [Oleidesulfovibrio alaskensis]ABB39228.1 3-oxoacyl-(acyl-carrier-protein) synthase 2 [Oleidesulfovibrio alaskensis G20]MBG0772017.1 beta-ketoacyl-ACP synthase II [Oleidesulfovibrio alaskensis]
MTGKRVVVTGLAAITPLGNNVETSWENLIAGKSGIGPITRFDASEYTSRVAGEVKGLDLGEYIPPKQARRMDRFTQYAVACAKQLMKHAEYTVPEETAHRVACLLGVGLGGLETIEQFHTKLVEAGPNRISPFMIPQLISNMAPGQIAMEIGAKGGNVVMTSACASGTHAIGYAFTEVKVGRYDAVVTGGAESTITPMGVSGFTALRALSTASNDAPEKASRPFDANRDGFVIGEGAGLLLVESLESARARGATIYAEIVGFGSSDDAFHMTAPRDDAEGMARAMLMAIEEAGISPADVDCINAHGTSTQLNDKSETLALKKVFGDHASKLRISANKSQTGHLLGAAGGVEGVFSCLTLATGTVPGTANYETPDEDCDLNYMGGGSESYQAQYVLSNSFGFGGTNACMLFKRWEG